MFKFCINGFLSGDPFTNPNLKDPSAQKLLTRETDEEFEEERNEWRKRPIRVRIVFLIAGLLQITFAILLVTRGISSLQESTDTIEDSAEATRLLLDESISVSQSLLQIGDTAVILRDQIVFDLDEGNFCPDNPSFNETQAGKEITGAAVKMLNDLGNFVKDNVAGLEESLDDGNDNLDGVDDLITGIEAYEWVGKDKVLLQTILIS
jgi:Ca2+/Na+ antiporter